MVAAKIGDRSLGNSGHDPLGLIEIDNVESVFFWIHGLGFLL